MENSFYDKCNERHWAPLILKFKGEESREFDFIGKPKNVCLSKETRKELSSFLINYHPSAIKVSISASGQRQNTL